MERFNMKKSRLCRVLAVAVAVVLVIGVIFQVNMWSAAEETKNTAREETIEEQSLTNRVTDENTLDSWKQFFGDDTSQAGKVWTDKSVIDGVLTVDNTIIKETADDNFTIGLSAMSSNTTITQQQEAPMDVMLVLDVSESMRNGEQHANYIPAMINAINNTIRKIQELNTENRVGLVVYSGQIYDPTITSSACILPLDRYVTAENEDFVVQYEYDNYFYIQVSEGLQTEDGQTLSSSIYRYLMNGVTYIQNGLLRGWECMTQEINKEHTPVIVLLSDGVPNVATLDYGEIDSNENVVGSGFGDRASAFLTQLTASWIHAQINHSYNKEGIFFTVGTGGTGNEYENIVLSPSENQDPQIEEWWSTFLQLPDGDGMEIELGESDEEITMGTIIKRSPNENEVPITEIDRNYVDRYFTVSTEEDLENAFEEIVDEIEYQPSYEPLNCEELRFEDKIGQYMKVNNIRGVLYDGTLYTGQEFSDSLNSQTKNLKEILKNRIVGLNDVQATKLSEELIKSKENCLVWYSDEDGTYSASPTSIKNETYFFSGNSGIDLNNKWMYLDVTVKSTKISETEEEQVIIFSVPTELIPVLNYQIVWKQDGITLTKEDLSPIRLFYDVGIKKDITEDTVESIIEDSYEYKIDTDKDGIIDAYQFYTNAWNSDNDAETKVNYTVSDENEFYKFQEDTDIFIKDGENFTEYKGETKPNVNDENQYFYSQPVYSISDGISKVEIEKRYIQITDSALEMATKTGTTKSSYCIPFGTLKNVALYQWKNAEMQDDSNNKTNSVSYVVKEQIGVSGSVGAALGNNGCGEIKPARGDIYISKEVIGISEDSSDESKEYLKYPFAFDIKCKLQEKPVSGTFKVKKSSSDSYEYIEIPDTGIYSFNLKHSENITIYGLPAGTEVIVGEYINDPQVNEMFKTSINAKDDSDRISDPQKIVKNEKINVQFGNVLKILHMEFRKCDESVMNPAPRGIGGAHFILYHLVCTDKNCEHNEKFVNESSDCWEIYDSTISETGDESSSSYSGKVRFQRNLINGEYRLVETKAPSGYITPTGEWKIEANVLESRWQIIGHIGRVPAFRGSGGGEAYEDLLYVGNQKIVDLPITGGRGIIGFIAIGTIIMIGAILFSVHIVLEKKRGKL